MRGNEEWQIESVIKNYRKQWSELIGLSINREKEK